MSAPLRARVAQREAWTGAKTAYGTQHLGLTRNVWQTLVTMIVSGTTVQPFARPRAENDRFRRGHAEACSGKCWALSRVQPGVAENDRFGGMAR